MKKTVLAWGLKTKRGVLRPFAEKKSGEQYNIPACWYGDDVVRIEIREFTRKRGKPKLTRGMDVR